MRRTGEPCIISFHDSVIYSAFLLSPSSLLSVLSLCIDDQPWVKLHPHYVNNNNNHCLYINNNLSSPFIFSSIYTFTTVSLLL